MKIFLVYEFCSIPDSTWDDGELAKARAAELDAQNCGEFASVHTYELNKPDGYIAAEVA